MELLKPPRLGPGDTIGIAAPASCFEPEKIYRGIEFLESAGFRIFIPDGIFERKGNFAGGDLQRAGIINGFFADDAVQAIFCARGGYGCLRILPLIDYEAARRHPKVFVGFSDITALLSALYSRCGMAVFHGPVVCSLDDADSESRESLVRSVSSGGPIVLRAEKAVVINPGKACGPVIGGNLTTLSHMVGTPFAPDLRGSILFLEDRGEAAYRIDRMITHLRMAGCLEEVAGLALGSFSDCAPYEEVCALFSEGLSGLEIPMAAGFDIGHEARNLCLPVGPVATLDSREGILSFHEAATSDRLPEGRHGPHP